MLHARSTWMWPIATDVAHSMVCLSVCWSHGYAVQKWLNRSRCCLGLTYVGPRNHVLDKDQDWVNPFAATKDDRTVMQPFAKSHWTLCYCYLPETGETPDLLLRLSPKVLFRTQPEMTVWKRKICVVCCHGSWDKVRPSQRHILMWQRAVYSRQQLVWWQSWLQGRQWWNILSRCVTAKWRVICLSNHY